MATNDITICSHIFSISEEESQREHILMRDCFLMAASQSAIFNGFGILTTKENRIFAVYDFMERSMISLKRLLGNEPLKPYFKNGERCQLKRYVFQLRDENLVLYRIIEEDDMETGKWKQLETGTEIETQKAKAKGKEEIKEQEEEAIQRIGTQLRMAVDAAKAYAASGDLILAALDNVNDAVSYAGKDGYVGYANKACLEMLETTKEDLVGANLHQVTVGKSMLLEVLKKKKSIIDMEYAIKYREKKFHFINSGYPVYGANGDLIGAIDIFRSMERSRKLANNLAGYHAALTFEDILHYSDKMRETVKMAKRYAKSEETVLLLGESGTGKELFAQSIHNYSDRRIGPFIAVNCANFVNDLIDSELFGYEEGAFTGASKGGKQGKFMMADGGTIFLDEIGEMPIHLQAKLLRVLETLCITRVGGNLPVRVNVRIIAATNQNLSDCIKKGTFRSDLYYRLKVLSLDIPSLRERRKDIRPLAQYFADRTCIKMGRENVEFSRNALRILEEYDWPGNVRELQNVVYRLLFFCPDDIVDEESVRKMGICQEGGVKDAPDGKDVSMSKERFLQVYAQSGKNKKRTAEILGISRPTVYKLIKKYTEEEGDG